MLNKYLNSLNMQRSWVVGLKKKWSPEFIISQCKQNHSPIFSETIKYEDELMTASGFEACFWPPVWQPLLPCQLQTQGVLKIKPPSDESIYSGQLSGVESGELAPTQTSLGA